MPEAETQPERDPLELSRRLVYFAAERTLAAWIRTALSLMALGFVIDRFDLVLRMLTDKPAETMPSSHLLADWAGGIMIALGACMSLVAGLRYRRFARAYQRDYSTEVGHSLRFGAAFAVGLGVLGLAVLVVLLAVLPS